MSPSQASIQIAALPDPANPTFIPIAATVGGILGATYARLRGRDDERIRLAGEVGAYWGGLVGVLVYLVLSAAEATVL